MIPYETGRNNNAKKQLPELSELSSYHKEEDPPSSVIL